MMTAGGWRRDGDASGPRCQPTASTRFAVFAEWHRYRKERAVSDKYRVNPNFVVPEPTAARFFAFVTEDEYRDGEHERIFDGWRKEGVQQARLTIVNDEYPHEPYPHGIWLEGWIDANARQLPFGEAENGEGPVYPPLVYENGKLASGMSASGQDPAEGLEAKPASPTAEGGDAQ